jgi:hypothetical protein
MTQAAARVDIASVTDALLPFVLDLFVKARTYRSQKAEFTVTVGFIWDGTAYVARTVVKPAGFIGGLRRGRFSSAASTGTSGSLPT